MPPEAVPSNASVALTGKGLRYIGNHSYALSGKVANVDEVITPTTVCLDFTTGAEYHVGRLGWLWYNDAGSADTTILIEFNDQAIWAAQYASGTTANRDQPLHLVIPPLTHVKVLWGLEGLTNYVCFIWEGRVYGAD